VPIVRATGGLDDTIQDFNPAKDEGNGFKFKEYSVPALRNAIQRALQAYRDSAVWEKLMLRGMSADFSWGRSAAEYLNVYQETLNRKKNSTSER